MSSSLSLISFLTLSDMEICLKVKPPMTWEIRDGENRQVGYTLLCVSPPP